MLRLVVLKLAYGFAFGTNRLFGDYSGEDMIVDGQSLRVDQEDVDINATEVTQMAQIRETIANQMWDNSDW